MMGKDYMLAILIVNYDGETNSLSLLLSPHMHTYTHNSQVYRSMFFYTSSHTPPPPPVLSCTVMTSPPETSHLVQ